MFSLECRTQKGENCIFPFNFRGKEYNDCTSDHLKKQTGRWCATAVHRNGTVIKNNWGYCDSGKIFFHLFIFESAIFYVWNRLFILNLP